MTYIFYKTRVLVIERLLAYDSISYASKQDTLRTYVDTVMQNLNTLSTQFVASFSQKQDKLQDKLASNSTNQEAMSAQLQSVTANQEEMDAHVKSVGARQNDMGFDMKSIIELLKKPQDLGIKILV